jgi:hypothetical protein
MSHKMMAAAVPSSSMQGETDDTGDTVYPVDPVSPRCEQACAAVCALQLVDTVRLS